MLFSGCFLFADIDGTLITYEKVLPEENLRAIEYFKQNGGRFALATGRSVISVKRAIDPSMLNAPSIIYNGGCIYDFSSDTVYHMEYLPEGAKRHIAEVEEVFPNIGTEIHVDRDLFCTKYSRRSYSHISNENDGFKIYTVDELCPDRWHKILFTGEKEEIDALSVYMAKKGDCGDYYFLRSEEGLFEVLPKNAAKGKALFRYCELFNTKIENIYAIGDYFNDINLLECAGCAATVADAPDEVKTVADYITCPCEQGAVADFIKYIERTVAKK